MNGSEIEIYLVSESCLLREALVKMLTRRNEMRVTGASGMTSDAFREIVAAAPDVLLCDVSLAKMSGVSLVPELTRVLPELKIVLFGMSEDSAASLSAVRIGVRGYLTREASGSDIAGVVIAVAAGRAVCPPGLCSVLFDYVAGAEDPTSRFRLRPGLGLTRREQQLVGMLACGLTNKEIAAKLFLSEYTIKNHVHRILKKIGADCRMAVVEQCRVKPLFGYDSSHSSS